MSREDLEDRSTGVARRPDSAPAGDLRDGESAGRENPVPGLLFLVVGPSGVGKNSLIEGVLPRVDRLAFVPSVTNRAMRPGEQPGEPYFFVSDDEFRRRIEADELLEWKWVHGNRYGTSRPVIEERLAHGLDAVTDVDVQGAHDILVRMPLSTCTIFVTAPSDRELARRIRSRHGGTPRDLERRLTRAAAETSLAGSFDYVLQNADLELALATFQAILRAHGARQAAALHGVAQGFLPLVRTISFEGDGLELPKVRLAAWETPQVAFARSLVLANLRDGSDDSPTDLRLEFLRQETVEHRRPTPYQELEQRFAIVR